MQDSDVLPTMTCQQSENNSRANRPATSEFSNRELAVKGDYIIACVRRPLVITGIKDNSKKLNVTKETFDAPSGRIFQTDYHSLYY